MLQNWFSEETSAATAGHWIAAQREQLTAVDMTTVTDVMAAAAVAILLQHVFCAVTALGYQ